MIMDLVIILVIKSLVFSSGFIPIFVADFLFSIVLLYFLNSWVNQIDGPEEAKGIMIGAALFIPAMILFPIMLFERTFRSYLHHKLKL